MTPYRTSAAPAAPSASCVARLRRRLRAATLLAAWLGELRAWRRLCGGRWERHFLDWPFLSSVWLPVEEFGLRVPMSVGRPRGEDWP